MTLDQISTLIRVFVFAASVVGLGLALLSLASAHLDAVAMERNGDRRILARARRAGETWSIAAQIVFLAVGISFIAFPPPTPTTKAQLAPFVDGLLRIAGFGFGAVALATKSLLTLMVESRLRSDA